MDKAKKSQDFQCFFIEGKYKKVNIVLVRRGHDGCKDKTIIQNAEESDAASGEYDGNTDFGRHSSNDCISAGSLNDGESSKFFGYGNGKMLGGDYGNFTDRCSGNMMHGWMVMMVKFGILSTKNGVLVRFGKKRRAISFTPLLSLKIMHLLKKIVGMWYTRLFLSLFFSHFLPNLFVLFLSPPLLCNQT